jgi:hypothetical protein
LVFSATATKPAGIEKVTSCPKIGEITVKAAGAGACADADEASSTPSVAIEIVARVIAGALFHCARPTLGLRGRACQRESRHVGRSEAPIPSL